MEQVIVEKFENKFFITLPVKIMDQYKLNPVMSAKVVPTGEEFILKDFDTTSKIRLNFRKKDLKMLRAIMRKEGYASLDETFNNVVRGLLGVKEQSVYIYPEGFIQSGCELIEEYEKLNKRKV